MKFLTLFRVSIKLCNMGKKVKNTSTWHMKQAQKCLRRIQQLDGKHPEVFERLKQKGARHIEQAKIIEIQERRKDPKYKAQEKLIDSQR